MENVANDLYQLEGVTIARTIFDHGKLTLFGNLQKERETCPKCQCSDVIFIGSKERTFRLPPTGSNQSSLKVLSRRQKCKNCKAAWWPQMPFTKGKMRMSISMIEHILDLLEFATIQDVARHLNVGWDLVKEIHKEFLEKRYKKINISDLIYISIDEISIAKGHKYMTIISDIRTGRVVHAVKGREKKDIIPFLESLKKKVKS